MSLTLQHGCSEASFSVSDWPPPDDPPENVLVPAVEAAEAAAESGKVRVLYVLPEHFPHYGAAAIWQDTKLGVGKLRHWERIALVGDADWLRRSIHALGWMMPGEVKMFGTEEVAAAREWIAS